MPDINLNIEIFDPAVPFNTFELKNPGLDTWHEYTLITKEARSKLSQVSQKGLKTLRLSGGMLMQVPMLEIGVIIGSRQKGTEGFIFNHHACWSILNPSVLFYSGLRYGAAP